MDEQTKALRDIVAQLETLNAGFNRLNESATRLDAILERMVLEGLVVMPDVPASDN